MGNFRRVYLCDFPCQMCRKPFRTAVQFKTGADWNLDAYENGQIVAMDYEKGRGGLHPGFRYYGSTEESYCPECVSKYPEDFEGNWGVDLSVRVAPSRRIWVKKPRKPRGFTIEEYRERKKRIEIQAKKDAKKFNQAFYFPSPKIQKLIEKASKAGSQYLRSTLREGSAYRKSHYQGEPR